MAVRISIPTVRGDLQASISSVGFGSSLLRFTSATFILCPTLHLKIHIVEAILIRGEYKNVSCILHSDFIWFIYRLMVRLKYCVEF